MARVIIVPGLAVRSYAEGPAAALRERGHEVTLLPAPGWHGQEADLRRYGERLAAAIDRAARPVDLLIGLSVGTQAAAVAAARTAHVRRLLLVSPTVDPARRNRRRLIAAWFLAGDDHRDSPRMIAQAPDWAHAGLIRIYRGLVSAIRVPLEEVLPQVSAPITVVHADSDRLSPLDFAAGLADSPRVELIILPDAPHSWPIADHRRFVNLAATLLG